MEAKAQKKLRSAGISNPKAIRLDIPTPPALRECLARGLFGSGISPRGHREISSRTRSSSSSDTRPLPAGRRPARPSSPPFAREGFGCGDGWFEIINRLSAKLSADPNLVVGQLKEKLGLLRIYFEPSPLPSSEIEEATDAALADAVAESRVTCERCGKPGKHAQRGGRWSAKCDACAAKEARRGGNSCRRGWRGCSPSGRRAFSSGTSCSQPRANGALSNLTPEHALALLEKYPVLFREAWAAPKSPRSPIRRRRI